VTRVALTRCNNVSRLHRRRVFLLGPSHHWHTKRCALSLATHYCSPLGDVPVDAALNAELQATRQFDTMTADVDAAEHSLELHVPFLVKLFTGRPFTLVPILVGALSAESEAQYGRLLSGYLDEPDVLMVVSSDFCHWGRRFGYTPHDKAVGLVHKYVEAMDREGMRIIESGDSAAFTSYLADTRNTICGRHPIGVLLHALRSCRTPALRARFTAYAQSSRALKAGDSSVSYATAVVES